MEIIQQIGSRIDEPLTLFIIFFILAAINLFFPPAPLESAILFGGFLASTGKGSLLIITSAATLGTFSGGMILFWVIRRYGYEVFPKTLFKKVIAGQAYLKMAEWFDKYGIWSMFFGKFIPGMSLGAVVLSGIFHWKTTKAAVVILGSNLLFFAVLAVLGRLIGANWEIVAGWLKQLNFWAIGAVVFLVTGIILYSHYRRRRKKV